MNEKQKEINNLFASHVDECAEIVNSMGININNLTKQKIDELKTNDNLKKSMETQDGKKLAELTADIEKIQQIDYKDNNKGEDEKLTFVLKYVYDHANEKNTRYVYSDATHKSGLLLALNSIMEKLNKAKLEKNQSVNPLVC